MEFCFMYSIYSGNHENSKHPTGDPKCPASQRASVGKLQYRQQSQTWITLTQSSKWSFQPNFPPKITQLKS